jgi:hypothetical protein
MHIMPIIEYIVQDNNGVSYQTDPESIHNLSAPAGITGPGAARIA